MGFTFTREMQADLQEVDNTFHSNLLPWWSEISDYVPYADQDMGYRVLPAMVINAYQYLNANKDLTIKMATLLKTVNFANLVHRMIKDDGEGQEHNQHLQFTILIGDYIFGRVLKLLLETEADKLLDIFANMIATINEGLVIKYNLHGDLIEVLEKTRAPMYSNAFLSAGKLSGLAVETSRIYGEIGYNLGMALELVHIYDQRAIGHEYLDKAELLLEQIQVGVIPKRAELENLMVSIRCDKGGSIHGL